VLEVFRDPEPDRAAPHGWGYRTVERLEPGATVALLALPSARLRVSDFLP
jgi:hypothetical protein